MQATAELQVIPLGAGVSVRQEILQVVELLEHSGLHFETHASGTNLEGELHTILATRERVHTVLHAKGTIRLVSYLKVETRTDKLPTLAGKKL